MHSRGLRDLWLELRRISHALFAIQRSRRLSRRNRGRSSHQLAQLRHHLYGTLPGITVRKCGRLPREFSAGVCGQTESQTPDRAQHRRRQRAISEHRANSRGARTSRQGISHGDLSAEKSRGQRATAETPAAGDYRLPGEEFEIARLRPLPVLRSRTPNPIKPAVSRIRVEGSGTDVKDPV